MTLAPRAEPVATASQTPVSLPGRELSERTFPLVVGLFALSGGAGLVDQVCFSKYLSYVVGSTAYAVSAVLAAFMAGLAFGAHMGGRWAHRVARPLVAYGVMEIVAGVAIALAPFGFARLSPVYVGLAREFGDSLALLSFARWVFATALVLLPTFAFGTTLPLLAPALAVPGNEARKTERLGMLYAANTFGGAFGALGAAFIILPTLGLRGTMFASAAASITCGAVALWIGRHVVAAETDSRARTGSSTSSSSPGGVVPFLAFASGALIFTVEVVATHLLAVIIGNSAFAFGLILAIFLGCLCLGAAWAPRFDRRFGARALPLSLLASAALLAATLPVWEWLPALFGGLGKYVTTFAGRELMRSLVAFSVLALPVTCMGLTFPLLLQRVARASNVGFWVGRITAVNTVGAVSGALAAGYVLLPLLGSQGTLASIVVAFAACTLIATPRVTPFPRSTAITSAVVAGAALVTPTWSLTRLTAGTNVYFDQHEHTEEVLFSKEDVQGGMTTVTRSEIGVKTLYTNGKFQGNDGWELQAQRYFAHYPSMFLERFDRALVIGLGTATTLGTYTAYPWKHIDVVEISPSIVLAAREHFARTNRNSLDDPRVRLTIADGRNYLLLSDQRYDLIGMELSSVWFAGASNLYSAEYYQSVREHLAPQGIFQQWVQLHHIYDPVFATLLHTLRHEFAHVALFFGGGQGILVASEAPLRASAARLRGLETLPALQETLPQDRGLLALLDDVLVHDADLDAFLERVANDAGRPLASMVSTDDNLYLEYETPRGNVLPWIAREELVERIRQHRNPSLVQALAVP